MTDPMNTSISVSNSNLKNTSDPHYVLNQLSKLDKLDIIDKLEASLDKFEDLLQDSLNNQNSQISQLQQRNSHLEQSNFKLERAIDELWREVHGKNLILRGLEDNTDETSTSLFQSVCDLIFVITRLQIEPDIVYRMGECLPGKNRPVRIVLCKYSDRNKIFESRENLDENYSIAADLPTDMRVHFAILFKKKEELVHQGEVCKINFKTREITTESGKGFASVHGLLQPLDGKKLPQAMHQGMPENSLNGSFSKNGRGIKRHFRFPPRNQDVNRSQDRGGVSKYLRMDQANNRVDPNQPLVPNQ